MPSGIKKHIRDGKARIRRAVLDLAEQNRLISELTKKYFEKNESNGNIQSGAK